MPEGTVKDPAVKAMALIGLENTLKKQADNKNLLLMACRCFYLKHFHVFLHFVIDHLFVVTAHTCGKITWIKEQIFDSIARQTQNVTSVANIHFFNLYWNKW